MYKAPCFSADGSAGAAQDLPEALFDGVVNEPVLHQVVKAFLANQRQGTASAKSRSEVAGGSRKPWRQKGTGRARQGTIRAVQWEGGGVAFPPIPHSWRQRVPKKVRALARRSAFNARAEGERVRLIDGFDFDAPKTARLRQLIETMGLEGKVLILTDGHRESVYLSGRNLPNVEVRSFGDESAYDILWAGTVVIERSALEPLAGLPKFTKRYTPPEPEEEAAPKKPKRKAKKAPAEAEAAPAEPVAEEAPEAPADETPEPVEAAEEPVAEEAAAEEPVTETFELPKVSDLADFLAGVDDADRVRAMQAQDARKTAQAHYEARLQELEGGAD